MSDEPPTPPAELPTDIADTLDGYAPDRLRRVARYAEALADHKVRSEEAADDETDDRPDVPDGVPAKATITVKEINDNRYYYWQWRDGDSVTSKYKGPVDPDE